MNLKLFKKRLISFYSSWSQSNEDLWGNSDVILIYNPPADLPDHRCYHLSSQFLSYLLGGDFRNTIIVFTQPVIYFFCPKNKVSVLKTLKSASVEAVQARIVIHRKANGDDYGFALMDEILRSIRLGILEKGEVRPIVIGCVTGEHPKSKLLWSGANQLKYKSVGVETGVRKLISHGDCARVQMEGLPDKFEEMLNMANESNKVFGEKEKGKESGLNEDCGDDDDDDDDDDGDWVLIGEEERVIFVS